MTLFARATTVLSIRFAMAALFTVVLGLNHVAAQDALQTITGTIAFPQGAAVPAEGAAIVELRDSRAPDGAPAISQQRIPLAAGAQRFPFTLQTDRDRLDNEKNYVIRATVLDGQTPTWLSDSVSVDTAKSGSGNITLALKPFKAPPSDQKAEDAAAQPDIQGVEWVVDDIDGSSIIETSEVTLNFSVDGALSGKASCNTFRASYAVDRSSLSVSKMATTKRLCADDLMEQERVFADILSHAARYSVADDGSLIIEDENGRSIEASSE